MGKKSKKTIKGSIKKEKTSSEVTSSPNILLYVFLCLILCTCLLSAGLILVIELTSFKDIQHNSEKSRSELLGSSVLNQISHDFMVTQERLKTIAQNPAIHETLLNLSRAKIQSDSFVTSEEQRHTNKVELARALTQLKELSGLMKSSFPNADLLQILPWSHSGTAGIKSHGLKLRNNIEGLMVAKAGEKNIPTAEAYQYDKKWLLSFATPIIHEEENIGVILLTLNASFIQETLNIPAFTQAGKIVIKQKNNNTAIAQIGQSASSEKTTFELPLSQGEINIYLNESISLANTTAMYNIYITIAVLAIVISIVALIFYVFIKNTIKKDVDQLQRYANALNGIHPSKAPQLKINGLDVIIQTIEQLATNKTRSGVNHDDSNSMPQTLANIASATKKPDNNNMSVEIEGHTAGNPETTLTEPKTTKSSTKTTEATTKIKDIFRDYDIRGHAENELDAKTVEDIGKAIASEALSLGQSKIAIGMDGRLSGPTLKESLIKGILSTGCDAIDIGMVPTPVLYYATHKLDTQAGIMITGSHNSPPINGFKIVLDGQSLYGEKIVALAERINNNNFEQGQGNIEQTDIRNDYADEICMDVIATSPIKIVVDAGNGVGGTLAVDMLQQLDCEVIPLHCDVDGNFPNHAPDPSRSENMRDLIKAISKHGADLGIALDGDADRMVAVTRHGDIISGDQLLCLFADDVVSRNPAASVVFDVKCSRNLSRRITQVGGRPIIWKSGHSNIKAKMLETSAILGGEYTGHFFFKDRWYGFDDGIYAALRLVELLTIDDRSLNERISDLPKTFSTEELLIPLKNDRQKFSIIKALKSTLLNSDGEVIDIDGIRIDFDSGWGLIRASNTSTNLTARFEANSEEELARIEQLFQQALFTIDKKLTLPIG